MQIESEAMRFGTKMHLHLEEWLRDIKVPDYSAEGLAARKLIPLLPAPSRALGVEHRIEETLQDADSHGPATVYTGAIDVCDLRPVGEVKHWPAPTDNYATAPGPLVPYRMYDHKSCASLRWAKSRRELEDDISANYYGREVLRRTGESVVYSRWGYSERIGSKAEPRDFILTVEGTERRWQRTQQSVAEMRELHYSQKDWREVTGNYEHCGAFGGCQFRAQCSLQKNQEAAVMGLMDHLQGGGELGTSVAGPSASVVPESLEGTALGNSLATLFARSSSPKVALAPTLVEPEQAEEQEVDLMDEGGEIESVSFGINPPDATPADLQKDTVEKKKKQKREKKLDAQSLTLEVVAAPDESVDAPPALVAALAKAPRVQGPKPQSVIERLTALERLVVHGTPEPSADLEARLERIEARIARIEEAVGL